MRTDSRATRVRRHAVHALLGAVFCAAPLVAQQGPKPKPGATQDSINAAQQAQIDSLRNALGTVNIRLLALFVADSLTNARIDTLHADTPPPPDTTSSGVVELSRSPTDVTYEASWTDYAPSYLLTVDDGVSKAVGPATSPAQFSYPRTCAGPRDLTVVVEGWASDTLPHGQWYGYAPLGVVSVPARDPADCSTPPPPDTTGSAQPGPNEPNGFMKYAGVEFNALPADGRVDGGPFAERTMPLKSVPGHAGWTNPMSRANAAFPNSPVAQNWYHDGYCAGTSNGTRMFFDTGAVPASREVYVSWKYMVDAGWVGQGGGQHKMLGIMRDGKQAMWMDFRGIGAGPLRWSIDQKQGQTLGQRWLHSNVGDPTLQRGRVHRFELYVKQSSSHGVNDGVIRGWLDGRLVHDHTDVITSDGTVSNHIDNVKWDPIWGGSQGCLTTGQGMWLDDLYVSGR